MKIRTSEVPVGSCFMQKNSLKKKVAENKATVRKMSGKLSTRKIKGDPEVEQVTCPLEMLGVGMRRHPETMVEIGNTKPSKRKK
jgi:hypothetical protein